MEGPNKQTEPLTMMDHITSDSKVSSGSTHSSDGEMISNTEHNQPSDQGEEASKIPVESDKNKDSLKMNAGLLPFPDNLMSLLDSGVVSDIIRWLPEGDAFCLKPALFAERVLDKYFQGTKFESFTRKLNRWGFKRVAGQKVPPNTIAYYHKDFIRGSPKLLKNMNGGKAKNTSAREKIMRAQHKIDEDNDALLIASSHYQRAKKLESSIESDLKPSGNRLGLVGSLDQSRLPFLTSNPFSLEQELQNRTLQQQLLPVLRNQPLQNHYYNTSQSLAFQQQRDEAQMSFVLQQRGLQAMRDSSTAAFAQNQWINTQANLPIGSSGLINLPYSRLPQDSSFPSSIDLSTAGRLLLTQQANLSGMGNTPTHNNSINAVIQRLLESRAGSNVQESLAPNRSINFDDTTASRIVQQQLQDDQRHVALGLPNASTEPVTGTSTTDQQLIELYLLQQRQRNNVSNSASNL